MAKDDSGDEDRTTFEEYWLSNGFCQIKMA